MFPRTDWYENVSFFHNIAGESDFFMSKLHPVLTWEQLQPRTILVITKILTRKKKFSCKVADFQIISKFRIPAIVIHKLDMGEPDKNVGTSKLMPDLN